MTHLEASCDVSGFPLLSPRQDVSSELFLKRGYHISKEDLDKGYGCSDSVKRPNAFVAVRGDRSIVRPLELIIPEYIKLPSICTRRRETFDFYRFLHTIGYSHYYNHKPSECKWISALHTSR